MSILLGLAFVALYVLGSWLVACITLLMGPTTAVCLLVSAEAGTAVGFDRKTLRLFILLVV
jgi:hypothetical protein